MKYVAIKLGIVLALSFVFSNQSNAQENYERGFYLFVNWIQGLDDKISQISDNEKKKRLIRHLGYLASDLDDLWISKENLHQLLIKELQDTSKHYGSFLHEFGYRGRDDFTNEFENFERKLYDIEERINDLKDDLTLAASEYELPLSIIDELKRYSKYKDENIVEMYMRVNYGNFNDDFRLKAHTRNGLISSLKTSMEQAVDLTKSARNSVLELRKKLEEK